jgi:asparagine synthase (glutamine-hydrolysing)
MYFASEIKALLLIPGIKREMNSKSLLHYLTYEYVPADDSLFQNIHKVKPAHYLVYKNNSYKSYRYWDNQKYFEKSIPQSELEALDKFDSLLEDSVRMRLVSDVPLGVFLSGGIDSSTIAYYAQKNSTQPISTFCIGFDEASYDDSHYARKVAHYLGTRHVEHLFPVDQLADLVPEIYSQLDEPMADNSLIPTYLLSRMTREHVTVSLGGDGADELLWGYPTFFAHTIAEKLRSAMGDRGSHLLQKIAHSLPTSFDYFSLDFKIKRFIDGYSLPMKQRELMWTGAFMPHELSQLLHQEYIEALTSIDDDKYEQWHWLQARYQRGYLSEDILVKVDRASMMNSLEVRAPFLDYRLGISQ